MPAREQRLRPPAGVPVGARSARRPPLLAAGTGPGDAARPLPGAEVRWTGRHDGDFASPDPGVPWSGLVDMPVCRVRQVHGDRVVVVERPGDGAGEEGDALVTRAPDLALAVVSADCAPIALSSPEGVVAAVHAGWRGLRAGIVERAVEVMRAHGATEVHAALGPCIRVECCEFGPAELDEVATALGAAVRGTATSGAPALDVPAAVSAALARAGAALVHDEGECTSCRADRYFSFRGRRDHGRQAMVVWRPSRLRPEPGRAPRSPAPRCGPG